MQIKLKRIYETASDDDGVRILVDRLWPRGLSKQNARIDRWDRDIAPSTELRRWFNHESEKRDEFRRRYFVELGACELLIRAIRYSDLEVKMPPTGKLADEQIRDFEQWVRMGAPDPRSSAPGPAVTEEKGIDLEEGRKFWAFQPSIQR